MVGVNTYVSTYIVGLWQNLRYGRLEGLSTLKLVKIGTGKLSAKSPGYIEVHKTGCICCLLRLTDSVAVAR